MTAVQNIRRTLIALCPDYFLRDALRRNGVKNAHDLKRGELNLVAYDNWRCVEEVCFTWIECARDNSLSVSKR